MTAAGGASARGRLPAILTRLLLPAAAVGALALAAGRQPSPTEALFQLGLIAGALLLAALVAPGPAAEAEVAAVALVVIGWAFPDSPARAAAIAAIALATLIAALARRFAKTPDPPLALWLAAALGIQLFTSAASLLRVDGGSATVLWLLPAVATAVACHLLAERRRSAMVLLACAASLLPEGQLTLEGAAALLALAGADRLSGRDHPPWQGLVALGAAGLVEPRLLLGGAIIAVARRRPRLAIGGATLGVFAAALVPARSISEALVLLALLPLLLPGFFLARPLAPQVSLVALLLAASCALGIPAAPLALPLAWCASELPSGASRQLTGIWLGGVTLAVAVLASYPWARPDPLADALGWIALEVDWRSALVVLAVIGLLRLATEAVQRRTSSRGLVVAAGSSALAAAVLLAPTSAAGVELLGGTAVALDHTAARRTFTFPPRPVGEIVLDTSLANAAELPGGTPVASMILRNEAGSELSRWVVRAGADSAEWSVRRTGPPPVSPRPWLTWVAERHLLGQRYRARFSTSSADLATQLEVALSPEIPSGIVLTLFHLQVVG